MKFPKAGDIISSSSPLEGEVMLPGGGGDDFLSRINRTISNFKELLAIAQQFKGLNPTAKGEDSPPGKPGGGMGQLVQLLIAAGYGDTPIGKLIEEISPYTVKQLTGMVKNVRPK